MIYHEIIYRNDERMVELIGITAVCLSNKVIMPLIIKKTLSKNSLPLNTES